MVKILPLIKLASICFICIVVHFFIDAVQICQIININSIETEFVK